MVTGLPNHISMATKNQNKEFIHILRYNRYARSNFIQTKIQGTNLVPHIGFVPDPLVFAHIFV